MPYDMADYLCPANGKPYLLNTGENCQSIKCPDGWREQRKNALVEEFYVSPVVVGRGADTSSLYTPDNLYHGTFYVQYTLKPDGTLAYGAPWAGRFMEIGQTFHRKCTIITYSFNGDKIKTDPNVETDLTLVAHHDLLKTPAAQVADVLEFQWGGNERYFYAKDFGLVQFKASDGGVSSYLVAHSAPVFAPHAHPIPRPFYQEQPTMQITVKVPAELGTPVPSKLLLSLKLHSAASLASASITLPLGSAVTVYAAPLINADGYTFAYVEDGQGNSGYAAVDAGTNHTPSFDPPMLLPAPAPEPTPTPAPPEPTIAVPVSVYNQMYAAWVAFQSAMKGLPPASDGTF